LCAQLTRDLFAIAKFLLFQRLSVLLPRFYSMLNLIHESIHSIVDEDPDLLPSQYLLLRFLTLVTYTRSDKNNNVYYFNMSNNDKSCASTGATSKPPPIA